MNTTEFEKIEAFLKNKLEPKEKELFLKELEMNKTLVDSVELQKQLYFGCH